MKQNNQTPKTKFRKKLLKQRKLSFNKNCNQKIIERFLESSLYKKAENLMLTASTKDEIDTTEIIQKALEDGKHLFLPRCLPKTHQMQAVEIYHFPQDMTEGNYKILEPKLELPPLSDCSVLDLIVVPGLAFCVDGRRIGYGGGYYDRFLENLHVPTCALISEKFIEKDIPTEPFDRKVDYLITEKRIIDCLQARA